MKQKTTRKGLNCSEQFLPDPRNRQRQCHCGKPECQRASKAASQRRWTRKPENKNYFRGAENTDRVRQWRKANPGYRRKKTPEPADVLQDVCLTQPALLVGIIAIMTGHVQQEDIAASVRSFLARGADILRMGPGSPQIPKHENQTNPVSAATAARTAPI